MQLMRTPVLLLFPALLCIAGVGCTADTPPVAVKSTPMEPSLGLGVSGSSSAGSKPIPQAPPRPLDGGQVSERYPNEVPGFQLHAGAKWASIEPTVSTLADVRAALGEPTEATDLHDSRADYPGDDQAKQPLLIYALEPGWSLYVYLVKTDDSSREAYDRNVWDTVGTLDVLPDNDVSLDPAVFDGAFTPKDVMAADASWTAFSDTHGLSYQLYRASEPDAPRRLNRISYGPSKSRLEEVRKKD